MISKTIYARHTDKEGKVHVAEHRVWDEQTFMNARQEEAKKIGGKSSVEQITRYQYLSEKCS